MSPARRPASPLHRRLHPWALGGVAVAVAAMAVGGCGLGKPKNFENENDTLRRKVLELEDQVALLRTEGEELRSKLAESERVRESALPPDVLEALPRCAGIEIQDLSGPDDDDGVDGPEKIAVYLRPFDGRDRFVQVAGRLTVEATLLSPGLGSEGETPRRLGARTLTPLELRDAYRYSIAGLYYSAEIALDQPNEPIEGVLVIRAELLDAVTGRVHRAELIAGGE